MSSGDGLGLAVGDGVGDAFFLLPFLGDGDGEAFGVGVSEGVGVTVALGELLFFGEALGFGVGDAVGVGLDLGDGLGLAFGEGDGVAFFVETVEELFRFFFGAGVGSKRRLIFVPRSCAPLFNGAVKPNAIEQATKRPRGRLKAPIPEGWLC